MEEIIKNAQAVDRAILYDGEQISDFLMRAVPILVQAGDLAPNVLSNLSAVMNTESTKLVPGNPGHFRNSILAVGSAFADTLENIRNFGVGMRSKVQFSFNQIVNARGEKTSKYLGQAQSAITQYNNCRDIFGKMAAPFQGSTKKIDALIAKMEKKGKPNEKQTKELKKLWDAVRESRAGIRKQREAIITNMQSSTTLFIEAIASLSDVLLSCDQHYVNLFDWIVTGYMDIALGLHSFMNELKMRSFQTDVKQDFTKFAVDNKLARYDLECPDFVLAPDDHTDIPVSMTVDFPIAIGEVLVDFAAGGSGEISCMKGKNMLLMEMPDKDEEWCCVMNPFTHAIGYVPTYCVKPKSQKLGLCIREAKQGEMKGIMAQIGDFVAVSESDPKEKMYNVETIHGDVGTMSKGLVAIIYE